MHKPFAPSTLVLFCSLEVTFAVVLEVFSTNEDPNVLCSAACWARLDIGEEGRFHPFQFPPFLFFSFWPCVRSQRLRNVSTFPAHPLLKIYKILLSQEINKINKMA